MSDPNSIGDWPNQHSKIADAAHVHAIGQFSLMYNALEELFGFVFQCSFPANGKYSETLFHSLSNRERADMLRAIIQYGEKDAAVSDRMLYAIKCFDIHTENRNIVLHAVKDDGGTPEILRLSKKARNDPARTTSYDISLATLRKVADEAATTYTFLAALFIWLDDRRGRKPPTSLPDKPPQPYRLSSSLPVTNAADKPRPHQS